MKPQDRLDALFHRWLDECEMGKDVSLEVLCADHPQLLAPFARRLRQMDELEHFLKQQREQPSADTSESNSQPQDTATYIPGDQPAGSEEYSFLSPPELPGEIGRLAGYRILEVLGEGGMGVVFRAEEQRPLRHVALKVIKPEHLRTDAIRRRFFREGQALAHVDHERVVPIHRVDESNGVPFLVMPLLRGESLAARLKREGQLPVALALRLGREIAERLVAAHAAGLVHRDIKPGNIWLKPNATGDTVHAVLLDFGLARACDSNDDITRIGAVVGTASFMAPEQAEGKPVDARADLFSLGAVLYQMLTGQRAFPGAHAPFGSHAFFDRQPPAPHVHCPEVPTSFSDLVMRLLERMPEHRPASATAVLADLVALEQRGPASHPVASSEPSTTLYVSPSRRRLVWLALAAVPIMLLLAVVVLITANRPSQTDPHSPPSTNPQPTSEPIAIGPIHVQHFRLTKDDRDKDAVLPPRRLGERSFQTWLDDHVTVEATLSRPAYAYLLAYRPDGTEELCYPERDTETPPLDARPRYPSVSRGLDYGLNEGVGLHVFLLVVSNQELPSYRAWRDEHGKAPWTRCQSAPGIVWSDDGTDIRAHTVEDPLAQRAPQAVEGKTDLARLTDWWRQKRGVEGVRAIGFAVGPR